MVHIFFKRGFVLYLNKAEGGGGRDIDTTLKSIPFMRVCLFGARAAAQENS